ncbi:GH32 C-terminal domain-containing protein [Colwellia sp. E150_009]
MFIKRKLHWLKISLLLTILSELPVNAAPLLHLTYNEKNGAINTIDTVNKAIFSVHHTTLPPERVPGVTGNAFRTNGYSTWLAGTFNSANLNAMTLETWIALESFPSTEETNLQESSLLHQKTSNNGFNLGINTYGQWWLDININKQNFRINAPQNFPLYNWTHVAFTVNNGLVCLLINGKVVSEKMTVAGDIQFAPDAPFIIGRAYKPQISQGIFEVNAINAAYDETKIDSSAKSLNDLLTVYNNHKDTPWQESIAVPKNRFADDHLRPQYHAMPPANWTNEPHGLVAYNGNYHMFYQRTANGPYKWMMHWGNMISDDLINWQHLKDAFYPRLNSSSKTGLGSKGIWSGDVVVDNRGKAHAFYTTVNFNGRYNPGIAWATSTDILLEKWTQHGGIIDKNSPNAGAISDFRDPYLWQENNSWHMIIGSAMANNGGIEYYTTTDINSGKWQRAAKSFSTVSFTDMDIGSAIWEMPVFEYLGKFNGQKKYVLIVSPIGGAMKKNQAPYVRSVYWTGTWTKSAKGITGQFTPDYTTPKNLDVIHGHISPTLVRNTNKELVAIGIVDERTNAQFQNDTGWAHTYSLPRILRLLDDGQTIGQQPTQALTSLRKTTDSSTLSNILVYGEHKLSASGNQTEIILTLDSNTQASEYGFYIATSPNKEELTKIYYDGENMVIDKSKSTLTSGFEENDIYHGIYDEKAFGKPEKFHVFIDHSVISVFINDSAVFANRIYPSRTDSTGLYLYSKGASTKFSQVDVYQLNSASKVKRFRTDMAVNHLIQKQPEIGNVIENSEALN